jgi:hypothetical protein
MVWAKARIVLFVHPDLKVGAIFYLQFYFREFYFGLIAPTFRSGLALAWVGL